jgi:predicted dehydrogenase
MSQSSAISRRTLLQAGAAVMVAAPTIVPASALGRGGHRAPSDRITVGFIGCGKMANDYHLPTLLGFTDVQALAVCDVDSNRRAHAKQRVQAAYAADDRASKECAEYNDFRDLLARKDIDAVLIATPEHWHAIPIIEACRAGKDVYCEKPLTLTLAESKRCIEAVRKHKRVLQTGSQQRSNVFGDFRQACEFIRSGRIGEVKTVTVGVGGPSIPCDLPE